MNWVSIKAKCQGCVKNIQKAAGQYASKVGVRVSGLQVELRSMVSLPQQLLDMVPKSAIITQVGESKKQWSLNFLLFIASTIVVGTLMLLEVMLSLNTSFVVPIYLLALLLLIMPEIIGIKWESAKPYIIMASAIAVGPFIAPSQIFILVLAMPAISTVIFHLMLSHKGGKLASKTLFEVYIYSGFSVILATIVHPVFWVLVPVPILYAVLNIQNNDLNCDWSLRTVALLVLGVTLFTHLLSLPAVVCIHEAFIAIWLLKLKGMQFQSVGKVSHHLQYLKPGIIDHSVHVKAFDPNLRISLEKCDFAWCVTHLLKRGVKQQHEGSYTMDQFRMQHLPKNAMILEGEAIVEPAALEGLKHAGGGKSDLDRISNRLVPIACFLAVTAFSIAMMGGLGVYAAVGVGLSTLLACCPCVFLMLYFMERSFERMLNQYHFNVKVNFQRRCLEASTWPDFNKWIHVFDRTGVTHGTSEWSKQQSHIDFEALSLLQKVDKVECGQKVLQDQLGLKLYKRINEAIESRSVEKLSDVYHEMKNTYVMYDDAKDWFESKNGAVAYGLSAAQEHEDSYRASMTHYGVDVDVNQKYQLPKNKANAFDRLRSQSGMHAIMYADGYNDSEIFERQNVLGVAVRDCADAIKDKAICWVANLQSVQKIIPAVIDGQKYAAKLARQGIHFNAIAMLLPVLTRVVYAVVLPMWTSCVLMASSMLYMHIQTKIKIRALKLKHFESPLNSFKHNKFKRDGDKKSQDCIKNTKIANGLMC
ncbi:hypothetical protein OAT84_03815 [Gammaproteobacteria bacterium]|nr:hypothetical protein [Gammaproteobacteria bacterium]